MLAESSFPPRQIDVLHRLHDPVEDDFPRVLGEDEVDVTPIGVADEVVEQDVP